METKPIFKFIYQITSYLKLLLKFNMELVIGA